MHCRTGENPATGCTFIYNFILPEQRARESVGSVLIAQKRDISELESGMKIISV